MNEFQKFLDETLVNVHIDPPSDESLYPEPYDIYNEIRDAVVTLRRRNHLTQKELAARTGITQANICNLEKGVSKPTIDSLKKIADATGTRLVVAFIGQEVE
jgi:ribosome-binding protein aMBF1 (putative translation factor)